MSRQQVQKESNQPGVSLPGEKQDPLLKEELPGTTNRKKMELDEKNKGIQITPGRKDEGQTDDDEPVEEKSDKL